MARILILGRGVFGRLAAYEAGCRGHDAFLASRSGPIRPVDASDATSVAEAIVGMDAVLHAAGPYQGQPAGAAVSCRNAGITYVDISDELPFSERVVALGEGAPLLTGMSTTPAVVEALAAVAMRRAPHAVTARCALYAAAGNRQGPATARFAGHARLPGRAERVDYPSVGARRSYPARGHFAPEGLDARFVVAVGGLAAIGWRLMPLVKPLAPVASRLPRGSRDTATSIVVDLFDARGRHRAREAVYRSHAGQRVSVLPALWALEKALAGQAPHRATLPRDWVNPDDLLGMLAAEGFERVSEA